MFSGVIKIADIDDYITPSQNCIKPISDAMQVKNNSDQDINTNTNGKKTKIIIAALPEIKNEIGYDSNTQKLPESDLIKLKNKETKVAKITLNDCLACNGCVTTAETLLIQAQSVDEFLKNAINENKISICCISPQSMLSLAYHFNLNESEAMNRLCSILEGIGVKYILNFNTILKYCLDKSYEEFKEKILKNSLEDNYLNNNNSEYIISSECPGWICYAEKKIGEWILPNLSLIKSPQQIIGNFLKTAFSKIFQDKEIYISCIMPCFDKKLEATRENHKIKNDLEVDTVISTIEMPELFAKLNIDFLSYQPKKKQTSFYSFSELTELLYDCKIKNTSSKNLVQSDTVSKDSWNKNIDLRCTKANKNINFEIKKIPRDKHKCKSCKNFCKSNINKDDKNQNFHIHDKDRNQTSSNIISSDDIEMKINQENYLNIIENKSENYPHKIDEFSSFFYTEYNFSSNGYSEYIIENLIKEKLNLFPHQKYEITRKNLKNSDYKEIELKFYNQENKVTSSYFFAIIYGFRNIQNLIRNKNKIKYHYIEVMACPGGCINGGTLYYISLS